ncbi:MAG: hypothetical protein ACOC5R_05980, partial [Elusimicrobiota bacterium]
MKTLTPQEKNIQEGHKFTYYRDVYLYKRYWDGSQYTLDSARNINNYIIKISPARKAQDLEQGSWKTANIDIKVKNEGQIWNRNSGWIWDGFIPEFSEIKIEFGYLDNGTKRTTGIFRGLLTFNGIRENLETRTATLHVKGVDELLRAYSAEELDDNIVTGETLGTGDGTEQTFTTANNGVGIINAVYFNGTKKDPASDYTVSVLNDKDNPAEITCTAPNGETVTVDYVYWYQDKTIDYLIEKLIDHAEITDYSIQTASFPNNVINHFETDTKTEWDNGTKDHLYTISGKDELYPEMIGIWDSDGGSKLNNDYYGGDGKVAQQFCFNRDITIKRIMFKAYIAYCDNCYVKISIQTDSGDKPSGTILEEKTVQENEEITPFFNTTGWNTNLSADTNYWVVLQPKSDTSWFYVYITEDYDYKKLAIQITPGTWSELEGTVRDLSESSMLIVLLPVDDNEFSWMSATEDCTTDLVGYGSYIVCENSGIGEERTFYTKSQNSDSGWPTSFDETEWDEVVYNVIASEEKRYLRCAIKDNIDLPTEDNDTQLYVISGDTVISEIDAEYYSSEFLISLADFSGHSVWSAIEELAGLVDYEFGFSTDRRFLFRSRNQGESTDKELYGVTKILDYKTDWNRLKNKITAEFGDYSKTMSPETEGESSP